MTELTGGSTVTPALEVGQAPRADEAERDRAAKNPWRSDPSRSETLVIAVIVLVIAVLVVALRGGGWLSTAATFGDNGSYIAIARGIRGWNPAAIRPYPFWGLSYVIAPVAVSQTGALVALLLLSLGCSIATAYLCFELWGGWTALLLVTLNWDWIQRSTMGGAEALFMLLLTAGFVAIRRRRWTTAAVLASLATTVRPQGVLALAAIAAVLLWRRDYRRFVVVSAIGLAIGCAYVWPFWHYYGDPLASVHFYQHKDWASASPVALPFVPLLRGMLTTHVPLTNLLKNVVWLAIVVLGIVAMATRQHFRAYARQQPTEVVFAALYLLFLVSYNSPEWGWEDLPRYALPALPFVFYAIADHRFVDRRILWVLAPVSGVLASLSVLNVHALASQLRRFFA